MSRRDNEEAELRLDASDAAERRTLTWVLAINFTQFLVAGTVGLIAQSTGLLGAALDNLADSAVYIVSLFAVGRTVAVKARAATMSGVLLIILAIGLAADVIRRFWTGSDPIGLAMIITAIANAATNIVCLKLLHSHRERGVHLKASWIFTANDMLANLGIVLSGMAVIIFKSSLPDLLIGSIVVIIVIKGGWEILEHAREARDGS
jgi:Co/Zn/Cd efflux system component